MRWLILAFALICAPARAETTTLLKSWGDNRPADQFISLTASKTVDGYDLLVVADDQIKPVRVIVIMADTRIIAICSASICNAFLALVDMAMVSDVLVTIADSGGSRFNVPVRLLK